MYCTDVSIEISDPDDATALHKELFSYVVDHPDIAYISFNKEITDELKSSTLSLFKNNVAIDIRMTNENLPVNIFTTNIAINLTADQPICFAQSDLLDLQIGEVFDKIIKCNERIIEGLFSDTSNYGLCPNQ